MLSRKKRRFAQAWNRKQVGFDLLKACIEGDKEFLTNALMPSVKHDRLHNDSVWYAVESFLMLAHERPRVRNRLEQERDGCPTSARVAFTFALEAARIGNPRVFVGGSGAGQAILVMTLALIIVEDAEDLTRAGELLSYDTRPLKCVCLGEPNRCPSRRASG